MAKAPGNLEYFRRGAASDAALKPFLDPRRIDYALIRRNS
jgi:hypothetical protein